MSGPASQLPDHRTHRVGQNLLGLCLGAASLPRWSPGRLLLRAHIVSGTAKRPSRRQSPEAAQKIESRGLTWEFELQPRENSQNLLHYRKSGETRNIMRRYEMHKWTKLEIHLFYCFLIFAFQLSSAKHFIWGLIKMV
jgi:hypothetical protein